MSFYLKLFFTFANNHPKGQKPMTNIIEEKQVELLLCEQ